MQCCFSEVTTSQLEIYDFCFVGAGVAGIIAANRLISENQKLRIILIDSGDINVGGKHDTILKKSFYSKCPIKKESRKFTVGGSSSIWGGLNAVFREEELDRSWLKESKKWPISYAELTEYYKKAAATCFFDGFCQTVDTSGEFGLVNERQFVAQLSPLNYKNVLDKRIHLLFNAHVTGLTHSGGQNIDAVEVKSLIEDKIKLIYSRKFILSAGTIETCKILLNSYNKGLPIGAEAKNIGRYFMNHPKGRGGLLTLKKPLAEVHKYIGAIQNDQIKFTGVSFPSEELVSRKLLTPYIRLEPKMPWEYDAAIFSMIYLVKKSRMLLRGFIKIFGKKQIKVVDFSETGDVELNEIQYNNLLKTMKNVILYLRFRFLNQVPLTTVYHIRNYMEMEPRYENKIDLCDQLDVFGNNEVMVEYQLGERDHSSLVELHEYLGSYFERCGTGSLTVVTLEEMEKFSDASHHMGGAIMGCDPSNSVVDVENKLHSMNNLYVLGSSVFPTSGSCNPTWTIAALSLRFAELQLNKMKAEI